VQCEREHHKCGPGNFSNFWRLCCLVRNMLRFKCDQDVPAQGAAEVLRNRQQVRNPTRS
jgi:hypothetical protein